MSENLVKNTKFIRLILNRAHVNYPSVDLVSFENLLNKENLFLESSIKTGFK